MGALVSPPERNIWK